MGDANTFGLWLKQRRRLLDLTQHTLAQRSGCAVETIRKIEANRRRPSKQLIDRLADALHLPPAERTPFKQLARGQPASLPAPLLHPLLSTPPPISLHGALPVLLAPFIGRAADLAALQELVTHPDVRLLTLSGAPGIGKTRLAVQVAATMRATFAHGVRFVELVSIHDPNLVIAAIAQALDVREGRNQPLLMTIIEYLREKHLLLVLDNFEQVVSAGPLIAQVLEHTPLLTVLVTSREVLHVGGEHHYVVPPLALPDRQQVPTLDEATTYAAIELFVQRARAAKQNFRLTEENIGAVVAICARLDGVPLAIELAAAWSRSLSPQAIARRLDQRLALLTGGAVDADARHQTLRQAIGWSYELLEADEQALFRGLGVFASGCRLDAAEAVAPKLSNEKSERSILNSQFSILNSLASLINKSLLQQGLDADQEPRFGMLEIIREYALERLAEHGEERIWRRRHANYYCDLAEQAEVAMSGPEQLRWMDRLEQEHGNLRAALEWAHAQEQSVIGARLAGALEPFWEVRGYWSEGRMWVEAMLSRSRGVAAPEQVARLAQKAGFLAWLQGEYESAVAFVRESLRRYRAQGNKPGMAAALHTLGMLTRDQGDAEQARALSTESLALYREISDPIGTGRALLALGWATQAQGDYERAADLFEESLRLHREQGDRLCIARSLNGLGETARCQEDDDRAAAFYEESLRICRELDNTFGIALELHNLGYIAQHQGDPGRAAAYFVESLTVSRELGNKEGIARCLAGIAGVARLSGQLEPAARLCGAAEGLFAAIGAVPDPADQVEYDRNLAAIRAQLDPATFDAAWAAGEAFTIEEAVAEALDVAQSVPETPPTNPTDGSDLTVREVEVLRLVAEGLTNSQIAEQLIVSPRTVHAHLRAIYGKLEVGNRSAATRFAIEHGLA
jgi:predicted ATPase/DNA-binding CsgD family transcriptional regulator/transcriptional regulator with XRE-family HTH domain